MKYAAPAENLLLKKLPEWQEWNSLIRDLKEFGQLHELGVTRDPKTGYELPLTR